MNSIAHLKQIIGYVSVKKDPMVVQPAIKPKLKLPPALLHPPVKAKKRRRTSSPEFSSGKLPDLEPGEVPDENYVPPSATKPSAAVTNAIISGEAPRLTYRTVYPCDESLMNVPFNAFNYPLSSNQDDYEDEEIDLNSEKAQVGSFGCTGYDWKPSVQKNFVAELLEAAKRKLSEEKETDKKVPLTSLPSFPEFPTSCESDLKKLKREEKKKIGRQYKVKFTNDVSMLRHHSNRWIKGGRLSTTGKYVETTSDDEEEEENPAANDAGKSDDRKATDESESPQVSTSKIDVTEEVKAMNALEREEEEMHAQKYDTHFVYEDTHQYAEYLRWYAETHGQPIPGNSRQSSSDEYDASQRQWFQFYRGAVKFADIAEDEEQTEASADQQNESANTTGGDTNAELPIPEKLEIYYQQWRWKQVHQWREQISHREQRADVNNKPSWTEGGASCSGQPVIYQRPDPSTSENTDSATTTAPPAELSSFDNKATTINSSAEHCSASDQIITQEQKEYYEKYQQWWMDRMLSMTSEQKTEYFKQFQGITRPESSTAPT